MSLVQCSADARSEQKLYQFQYSNALFVLRFCSWVLMVIYNTNLFI